MSAPLPPGRVRPASPQPGNQDERERLLHAAKEWIWRHTKQPNGDRWLTLRGELILGHDPNHLDWAAENLLCDLEPWLVKPGEDVDDGDEGTSDVMCECQHTRGYHDGLGNCWHMDSAGDEDCDCDQFREPAPSAGQDTNPIDAADPIVVTGEDGRTLLRIRRDGTVDGAIEDAGEAARIFVREVRRLVQGQAAGQDGPQHGDPPQP